MTAHTTAKYNVSGVRVEDGTANFAYESPVDAPSSVDVISAIVALLQR
jgi:hypothetical protein